MLVERDAAVERSVLAAGWSSLLEVRGHRGMGRVVDLGGLTWAELTGRLR